LQNPVAVGQAVSQERRADDEATDDIREAPSRARARNSFFFISRPFAKARE
jgi:hypothetical protein